MPWDENPQFLERRGWPLIGSSVAVSALIGALLALRSVHLAIYAVILFPGIIILNGTLQYMVRVSVPVVFAAFKGKPQ